jgi:hypothetical protein
MAVATLPASVSSDHPQLQTVSRPRFCITCEMLRAIPTKLLTGPPAWNTVSKFNKLLIARFAMKSTIRVCLRVIPMLAVALLYRAAHPSGAMASTCGFAVWGRFDGGCDSVCGCQDAMSSTSCDPGESCGGGCYQQFSLDCSS